MIGEDLAHIGLVNSEDTVVVAWALSPVDF
jgi:hypothetical protein